MLLVNLLLVVSIALCQAYHVVLLEYPCWIGDFRILDEESPESDPILVVKHEASRLLSKSQYFQYACRFVLQDALVSSQLRRNSLQEGHFVIVSAFGVLKLEEYKPIGNY